MYLLYCNKTEISINTFAQISRLYIQQNIENDMLTDILVDMSMRRPYNETRTA